MKPNRPEIGPRLRLVLAPGVAIGPGKAELLAGIRETGSIAAAGRRMGMSYKRAWMLTEALNRHFQGPLVLAATGGAKGGGAALTELGTEVLERYRKMERRVTRALEPDMAALRAIVISNGK